LLAGLQTKITFVARREVIVPLLNNGLLKVHAPLAGFVVVVVNGRLGRGGGRLLGGQGTGRRRDAALGQGAAGQQQRAEGE